MLYEYRLWCKRKPWLVLCCFEHYVQQHQFVRAGSWNSWWIEMILGVLVLRIVAADLNLYWCDWLVGQVKQKIFNRILHSFYTKINSSYKKAIQNKFILCWAIVLIKLCVNLDVLTYFDHLLAPKIKRSSFSECYFGWLQSILSLNHKFLFRAVNFNEQNFC